MQIAVVRSIWTCAQGLQKVNGLVTLPRPRQDAGEQQCERRAVRGIHLRREHGTPTTRFGQRFLPVAQSRVYRCQK